MANTYTKLALTGSTNGRGILITGTNTGGAVTLHTALASATNEDEVWIYAMNNHTANVDLSIEFGGTTSPNDIILHPIPFKQGCVLVVPGLVIQNGLLVKAFASVANVISIHGYVNRIEVV